MKKLVWLLTTILLVTAILMGCSTSGAISSGTQEEITLEVLPDDEETEAEDGTASTEAETAGPEETASYEETGDDDFFEEDEAYADYEDDASAEGAGEDFSYEDDDVWGDAGEEGVAGGETGDGLTVAEDGSYSSKEEVALYIHLYGKLPSNYITKKQAEKLGWVASKGNLWDVAPGKSIGGSYFGNYEGLLPDGDYRECDIDYQGGRRNAKRIVFSTDGRIYYTEDHYESFEQLY